MLARGIQLVKSVASIHSSTNVNKLFLQHGYKFGSIINFSTESEDINKKIDDIVKSEKIVVFMKGTPEEPSCGFSNAVVRILQMHGVEDYHSVNVLEDENMRSGVKEYSQWATIPQVFIGGEFIGGCDIMLELHKSGGLIDELNKVGLKSALKNV